MKILHLADLHIGKRIYERPLYEDQQYIFAQIMNIVDEQHPKAVLLSGDIYDKAAPSAEAIALFDSLLADFAARNTAVMTVYGNHDSAERIAFGAAAFEKSGIFMSPVFDGSIKRVTLCDEYGDVNFYLLPFIKPANVKAVFEDFTSDNYTEAVARVVRQANIDTTQRNILVCHQFFTGSYNASVDESVGGIDNVDASAVEQFDYVAAGHIHRPQSIGKNGRYSGTPLKYSFSESTQIKSATLITIENKLGVDIQTIPLKPLHDMREIRGTLELLTSADFTAGQCREDYLHITLTDEHDTPDSLQRLRGVYPNMLLLDYDNERTRRQRSLDIDDSIRKSTPMELFCTFYERQNNLSLSEQQKKIVSDEIDRLFDGREVGL